MTTIAYRNGLLAADGRVTSDGLILTDTCKKITRLSDGALFTLCGVDTWEQQIIEWLEENDGSAPPKGKGFCAILVDTDGVLTTYNGRNGGFIASYGAFQAYGSGCEIAYGAMEMGATAKEAVEAAIRRNAYSGGAIQVEKPGLARKRKAK